MSVSALINSIELEIDIPQHLICLPISFQRIYNDYWEPIINQLELPILRYVGILDVNYKMWIKVKLELLAIQNFIRSNPKVIEIELRKNQNDKDVGEYIINRIDYLIENMQQAYDLSDKVVYNWG